MKKKYWIPIGMGTGLFIYGLPFRTEVNRYVVKSAKIQTPVRVMVLSDQHNQRSGAALQRLFELIERCTPDLILMPGDMLEVFHQDENAFELMRKLHAYPVYYSTGNHEEYRNDLPLLLRQIRETGVRIPEDRSDTFTKGDTRIELVSLPCHRSEESFQASKISERFHTDGYRILLSHRPNWTELYQDIRCDLIVSGHAHGGQFRNPITKQGLYAPGQGFFPTRIQGVQNLGRNQLVISRGLCYSSHRVPRLFNNPEVVLVDLVNDQKKGNFE